MASFFSIRRTGIQFNSNGLQGEWSVLTVERQSARWQYDMIERRGGYVYLHAGTYRLRPWLAPNLVKYAPKGWKHDYNAIQPLVSIKQYDLTDMFGEQPRPDRGRQIIEIDGPDPDKQRGNILIHGVGGVGGLEGCLSPGITDAAGRFTASWSVMDALLTIVEREPVALQVLNDPIRP